MESVGSCVLAKDNPFTGQAGDIFQRRINGESWATIAKAYDLGSPSAARNLFKKLTGISDFKIKGSDLVKLAKGGVPTPPKIIKPKKLGDPKPEADMKKLGVVDIPTTPLSKASHIEVIELHEKGFGYADISKITGKTIPDIDAAIWKSSVQKHQGNVWKAYLEKPQSEIGLSNLKNSIFNARKQGLEVDEIVKHLGVDKDVVQKILKGTYKPPGPGTGGFPKPSFPTMSNPKSPPKNTNPTTAKPPKKLEPNFNDFPQATEELLDTIHSPRQLPPVTRVAVEHYTGSTYHDINGALRGQRENTTRTKTLINGMDKAMTPLKQNVSLTRGMSVEGLQMGRISGEQILGLKGKVISDPGYLSTSTKPIFGGGGIRLNLEVPAGAKGVWAKPLSLHQNESEFILDRSTKIMITDTQQNGPLSWTLIGRVIV